MLAVYPHVGFLPPVRRGGPPEVRSPDGSQTLARFPETCQTRTTAHILVQTRWLSCFMAAPLAPHHWRRCSAPVLGADRDLSAPLVGGHKTSEPTSFVASESPSKTTPESYNRTPYARDGRRNTDTQQVLRLGAGAPLCLCVHITRVPPHRRSRACSGEPAFCGHASPTPTPPAGTPGDQP